MDTRQRGTREGTDTPAAERAALVALYDATGGPNWTRNTNWNTTVPVSDWHGVTTGDEGSVVGLSLFRNGLSGTLPAALGDLTSLETLTLSRNSFSGGIPPELGSLANLELLQISRGGLSGGIPPELGNLASLTNLSLSSNGLSGSIPAALGGLRNLVGLWLNFNDLSQTIPPALGALANLRGLGLSSNELSGSVPPELGSLINLTHLNLQLNDLDGAIPASFGRLSNLEDLDLLSNKMSGPITVVGGLTNLRRLNLSDNASIWYEAGGGRGFSGPIPPTLGNATGLTFVNLSFNTLSGPIPATFGNLTNLESLLLDFNAAYVDGEYIGGLAGAIPASLANLTNLVRLDLSQNLLAGCVPAGLPAGPGNGFDRDLSFCATPERSTAVLVDGPAIHLVFDRDLDESSVPPRSAFAVRADGADRAISAVALTGRVVQLALESPIAPTSDVTVTYTPPTGPDAGALQNTVGDAADAFSRVPVNRVPDPPTITDITPGDGTLTISWDRAAGMTAHVLEWTQHNHNTPQTTRQRFARTFTISDLTPNAVYWIRIQGVNATEAGRNQTLYTTAWSQPQPAVAADWTPQNLTATPGDRSLQVTWDPVAGADGYTVEYRPSGGSWVEYRQGPETPRGRLVAGSSALLSSLDNATRYEVRVRAARRISPPSGGGEVTVTSAWANGVGVPGVPFRVVLDRGPRLVRGGAVVVRELRLAHALVDLPYARRPVAVDVRSGPSVGAMARCRVRGFGPLGDHDYSLGSCRTDGEGNLTVVYTAALVGQSDPVRDDIARVFADANGDSLMQVNEYSVDLGAVTVRKPVDYVALGDSFSSGQQGEGPYSGAYLVGENPADAMCARWDRSYSQLIRGWLPSDFASVETFACTGAITLNIHHPGAPDYNLPYTTGKSGRIDPDDTNRPSGSKPGEGPSEYRPGSAVQAPDWEPRQGESLRGRQGELGHGADMVTVTVGGNDLGFADAFAACFKVPGSCDEGSLGSLAHTRARLAAILGELKRLTRGTAADGSDSAAIFVLGYPYLVPLDPRLCAALTPLDLGRAFFERVFETLGRAHVAQSEAYLALAESIIESVSRVVEVTVESGGEAYAATVSFVGGVVAAAGDGAARAGGSIVEFGGGVGRGIIAFDAAAAQALGALSGETVDVVVDFGEFAVDGAVSFAGGAVRAYRAVGESYHYLSEGLGALGTAIADGAGGTVDVSVRIGADVYDASVSFAGGTVEAATAGAARTVRVIADLGGIAGEVIIELGADASRALAGAASGVVEVVVDFGPGALNATLDFVGGVVEEAPDLVDKAIEFLPDAFEYFGLGGTLVGGSSASRAARSPAELVFNPGDPAIQALVLLSSLARLDADERRFIRQMGDDLNAVIRSEAELAGVHFVDVAAASNGREPCNPHGQPPWIHGVRGNGTDAGSLLSSGSFHPTEAGQVAYADLLLGYIEAERARGAALTAAGLPVNPEFARGSRPRSARGAAGSASGGSGGVAKTASAAQVAAVGGGVLEVDREAPSAVSCGAALVPGERVRLAAGGFAADAAVTFSLVGATTAGAVLPAQSMAATADAGGRVEVVWVVPAMPASVSGSALRLYMVRAAGDGADGATRELYAAEPLVAYAAAAPCVVADAATTTLGRAVRVPLLANDTAPPGGSLDAATLEVTPVEAGTFAVNTADGSATFTPEAGFDGTVTTQYWVRDSWGIALQGVVTVTVDAGCTITGTPGVALIEGTGGDDVICVPNRRDRSAFHIIDAKAGDDVIVAGDGAEWILAGTGGDTVYAGGGDDEITGGPGDDAIHGGPGFDTVHSSDVAETVIDTPGGYELLVAPPASPAHAAPSLIADSAYVMPGETLDIAVLDNDADVNDNLVATSLTITRAPIAGTAVVVALSEEIGVIRYTAGAEAGVDTFAYEVCDTLGACATAEVTLVVGTSHCTIVGTDGDDELRGTPGPDVICGLGGNDVINGIGGDDIIIGGSGDDTLHGGAGDDTLYGGPGDDTLTGYGGADTLWGGAGRDALEGNTGDDTLVGGAGADTLNGGGGADTLWGGAGDDGLIGHAGDDALWGGPGDDALNGGTGDDTLRGGAGDDSLTGHAGNDVLWGGLGGDVLWGNTQNDVLWGGPGADHLHGGGHDDMLIGGAGGDTLLGNAGDDRLWGASGDDSVDGGDGGDYIDGGDGTDRCWRGESTARCES